MFKLILALSLICSSAMAQDSVLLNAGDKAPFQGYLSPSDKLNDYKLLTESLNKSIDLYKSNEDLLNQKISILTQDNTSLFNAVHSAEYQSDLQKILYFGLGIAITSLAIWGASKLRP